MKKQRRTRRHSRLKAPAGAFSDRYGARLVSVTSEMTSRSSPADPWLTDFPASGMAAATLIPTVAVPPRT